jgi:hypothetical protein
MLLGRLPGEPPQVGILYLGVGREEHQVVNAVDGGDPQRRSERSDPAGELHDVPGHGTPARAACAGA